MRNRLTSTLIALGICVAAAFGEVSPQDLFLQIYLSLDETQKIERDGQYATAEAHYKEILTKLESLKQDNPGWEPGIVNFRIKFVKDKIAALDGKKDSHPADTTPSAPAPAPAPSSPTVSTPAPSPAPSTSLASVQADVAPLRQQINDLQRELSDTKKELVETKSQLALAVGQAADLRQRLDAAQHELAAAKSANLEDHVAGILNENNALKVQLADAEKKMRALQEGASDNTAPALRDQLTKVQAQLAALQTENQSFRTTTDDLKRQLEDAKQKLALADQQAPQSGGGDSVRRENEVLRGILTRQLQEQARRDAAKRLASEQIESLHIESKVLQQQIEILGSPIVVLTPDEKSLLRVDPAAVTPSTPQTFEAHIDSVAKADAPAAENAANPPAASAPAQTPDAAPGALATPDASGRPKVPEEMKPMAQQAGTDFAQGKFDEAAAIYNKMIERYPDSLYAWSNLGVVRFQQQHYPEAEKALLQAIKLNPNDAFSFSILGIVYYQENRFDDAIEKLTRASTLDPNDARTRNYLGIACSQKGWQEAAEKQLRKAIEIDPNLGDAHFNLAVIYATQKPPSPELARKHYKAALDLGIPKDPQLEKFFDDLANGSGAAAPTPAAAAPSSAPATTPAS